MANRYYFDLRNANGLVVDDQGEVHVSLVAARAEAARSLAHLIQDAVGRSDGPLTELAIEVRDETGPVLHATFVLAILRTN